VKKKIFVISDHPFSPSGVGTQSRYFIEALLKTGRFKFVCFGGAIKHKDYSVIKTEEWGEDFVIYPIDGYGNHDMVRSFIRSERPDMLWFMTDPRFFGWLWEMEDEIRPLLPMVYYHVWDNYPYPKYNEKYYSSNDFVACISKVTHDIVKTVAPNVDSCYLPHAVDNKVFKKIPDLDIATFKKDTLNMENNKMLFFWNNRNARRKQSGSLIYWFNDFLDKVGKDKASLLMHTDVNDEHGQDLAAIINDLGLNNGEVMFSAAKVTPEHLSLLYNAADCTINISDAEGFGLSTLESLSCETPIIVNMTGGLQEQVTDGENWFGVGLEPASKAIIGSQTIPWIYEDRLSGKQVVDAMLQIYNMSPEERAELGKKGSQHVKNNYDFEKYNERWIKVIDEIMEKNGSWSNRKNYVNWDFKEVTV
jgi:glycosyltransferase involved in cell wall biosynthesis